MAPTGGKRRHLGEDGHTEWLEASGDSSHWVEVTTRWIGSACDRGNPEPLAPLHDEHPGQDEDPAGDQRRRHGFPRIKTPPITPITGTTYPISDAVVAEARRDAPRKARKGRTVDTVARYKRAAQPSPPNPNQREARRRRRRRRLPSSPRRGTGVERDRRHGGARRTGGSTSHPKAASVTPMSIKPTPSGRLALAGMPTSPGEGGRLLAQRDDHPTILAVWSGSSSSSQRPEGGPERHQCDEQTADPRRGAADSVKKKVGIAMLTTPRTAPSRHTGRSRGIPPRPGAIPARGLSPA